MSKRGTQPVPAGGGAARGAKRKQELELAGLSLLAESGWQGITARAVAERAGANPGLLHYHYGGMPGFRRAVAALAAEALVGQTADALCGGDPAAAIRAAVAPGPERDAQASLTAEMICGALTDPDVAAATRDAFRQARARLADSLNRTGRPGKQRAETVAAFVVAALDGIMLQSFLDEEFPAEDAAKLLASVVERLTDRGA